MTPWPVRQTSTSSSSARLGFDLVVIGQRLAVLLLAVAAYYVAAGLVVQSFELRVISRGSAASLINTLILSLLLSFRNRAAYDRWWAARGLWGQLTNDTRNLAAKCAAFVPADVLARSRVAEMLVAFAEALKRHLRDEPPRLRDLPGFEHEEADPPHVPLYLARRLFATVAGWKRDGHVDQAVLWVLDAHLRGLLDVCGGCEKIRNTPLSPSYKGLLRAGLVLNVLVAPWLIVPELGAVERAGDPDGVLLPLRRRGDRLHRRGAVRPGAGRPRPGSLLPDDPRERGGDPALRSRPRPPRVGVGMPAAESSAAPGRGPRRPRSSPPESVRVRPRGLLLVCGRAVRKSGRVLKLLNGRESQPFLE